MNITLAELQDERQRLTKDFNELKDKIQKLAVEIAFSQISAALIES